MNHETITAIEKNINHLLKLYDTSVIKREHGKSREYLLLIEKQLDLLNKNEVQIKTTLH